MKKFVTLFVLVSVFVASSVFAAPASPTAPAKKNSSTKKKPAAQKPPTGKTPDGSGAGVKPTIPAPVPTSSTIAETVRPAEMSVTEFLDLEAQAGSATTSAGSATTFSGTSSATLASDSGKINVVKKTNDRKKDILQIGGRLRSFDGLDTMGQPTGFMTESTDQTGVGGELSIQVKYWRFGLEYLPLENERELSTEFYGADLGKIKVVTGNVFIGKFFPVDKPDWSLSLGFGAEYTKLSGAIGMGGFVFPTKAGEWSPVFQIGGQYRLMSRLLIGADYEISNVRVVTSIPGVPDLKSTYTDRLSVRLMFGIL